MKSYAFIYIGQLRTWQKTIPLWHADFKRMKPDIYLFINETTNFPTADEFKQVFGDDATIKYIHFWSSEDMNRWTTLNLEKESKNTLSQFLKCRDAKYSGYSCQFYQLQRAFEIIDFSDYDVAVKFRFDAMLREGRPVYIDAPWDKHETVVPHLAEIWKSGDFNDYYRDDWCESFHKYHEGITLGGAYIINKEEEYKVVDLERVVWMMSDCVYWSTGKNMQILHKNIFDNYGNYYTPTISMSWSPEANLILHAKSLGLQPLMSAGMHVMRE